MSGGWVKHENATPDNLKVEPISDTAFRLWFNASCYCSRGLTDGIVAAGKLLTLHRRASKRHVAELIHAGLLDVLPTGDYEVHDYLVYNPSKAEVREMQAESLRKRDDAKERKRRQRERERDSEQGSTVTPTVTRDSHAPADAEVTSDPRAHNRSGPFRTGPGSSTEDEGRVGKDEKDKPTESELQKATPEQLQIVDTLAAQIRERDPKASIDPRGEKWLEQARLLLERDRRTPDEVMAVLAWLPTHQSGDFAWGAVILSMAKFRKQFTQLVAAMGTSRPRQQQDARPGPRAGQLNHEQLEERNAAYAAWIRENMPDITWGPEHGTLHGGVTRALFHLNLRGITLADLSVEEHGDCIRRSVIAWDRDAAPHEAAA